MNYHLLIVDEISLRYHLEYGFIGTGNASDDFNIGLWKDIARLKIGDKIIFYVQGIKKFYGCFQVSSKPFCDGNHHLQPQLMPFLGSEKNIKLRYRALIQPDIVFANGIDEFDLVDILPNNVTDILWSILYRKLKGGRGCSPLFLHEYNIIRDKLFGLNYHSILYEKHFSFNGNQIQAQQPKVAYQGECTYPNIKHQILHSDYTEHHLHALLIEHLPSIIFDGYPEWLGNEVYAGSGMQAIDILTICTTGTFNIIEIKKDEILPNVTTQVSKYVQWLQNRFQIFEPHFFQPIIMGREIHGSQKKQFRVKEFQDFNQCGRTRPIKYFEYKCTNENILLTEVNYANNWAITQEQKI